MNLTYKKKKQYLLATKYNLLSVQLQPKFLLRVFHKKIRYLILKL